MLGKRKVITQSDRPELNSETTRSRDVDESTAEIMQEIYSKYAKLMLYVANQTISQIIKRSDSYLAEDSVMETLIALMKHVHDLEEIDSPRTKQYILRATKNTAINLIKKQNYSKQLALDDYPEESWKDGALITEFDSEDLEYEHERGIIQKSIGELRAEYAEILELQIKYDYSHKDLAKVLQISEGNAKVRLSRARKALKNELEKGGYYEKRFW